MNAISQFNFENHNIRVVTINNEPWFVGKDIAKALGYVEPKNAITIHVDQEDKQTSKISSYICEGLKQRPTSKARKTQNMVIINESGLYSLIFSSKLTTAKKFKRWVTSEVLPQIRKTGSYNPNNILASNNDWSALRNQTKQMNKSISQILHDNCKANKPHHYINFHNIKYKTIYGKTSKALKDQFNIQKGKSLLDYMSTKDLAVNIICEETAKEKILLFNVNNMQGANNVHQAICSTVKSALTQLNSQVILQINHNN